MAKKNDVMEISGRRKFAVHLKQAEGRKPIAIIGTAEEVRGAAPALVMLVYGEMLEFDLKPIPFSENARRNC